MSNVTPKTALAHMDIYRPDTSGAVSADPIRLSVNEGALGPSPMAVSALRQMGERLHRPFSSRYRTIPLGTTAVRPT